MGDHFLHDADAILAAQQAKRAATFDTFKKAAKSDSDQAFLTAQFAAFDGQDIYMRLLIRMMNEGRSPNFIGSVIGASLANVICSTIGTVESQRCLETIAAHINMGLAAMDGQKVKGSVNIGARYPSQRGGRA